MPLVSDEEITALPVPRDGKGKLGPEETARRKAYALATFREHPDYFGTEIAQLAGVSTHTLHRWKRTDPDFRAVWLELLAAQAKLIQELLDDAKSGEAELGKRQIYKLEARLEEISGTVTERDREEKRQ